MATSDNVNHYIALNKTLLGTLPQWLFLQDFQLVTERKKKERANR